MVSSLLALTLRASDRPSDRVRYRSALLDSLICLPICLPDDVVHLVLHVPYVGISWAHEKELVLASHGVDCC